MAARAFLLAIEYSEEDVPANGCVVLSALAAPVKHKNKDAAGHCFHDFALKQAGLYGEYCYSALHPLNHSLQHRRWRAVVCSRGPSGEEARNHEHHGWSNPWRLPVLRLLLSSIVLLLVGSSPRTGPLHLLCSGGPQHLDTRLTLNAWPMVLKPQSGISLAR